MQNTTLSCGYRCYEAPVAIELNRAPSMNDALRGADAVIVATAHTEFRSIRASALQSLIGPKCVVFDSPRMFDLAEIENAGLTYLGTGYSPNRHTEKYP
jgi:UDP-N-acetyl-D-mannosaminuronate dehydrogenase